jgi:peroxiredoxin
VVSRTRLRTISLAVALVVAIVGGYLLSSGDNSPDATLDRKASTAEPIQPNANVQGKPLPNGTLRTADGDALSTAELTGAPMVVNFWNSTCLPCKKELADFAVVHADLGDNIRFVGVNDIDSDLGAAFARERGVTYELLGDPGGELGVQLGLTSKPVTLFVDGNGTIVHQSGVLDEQELRDLITKHLG